MDSHIYSVHILVFHRSAHNQGHVHSCMLVFHRVSDYRPLGHSRHYLGNQEQKSYCQYYKHHLTVGLQLQFHRLCCPVRHDNNDSHNAQYVAALEGRGRNRLRLHNRHVFGIRLPKRSSKNCPTRQKSYCLRYYQNWIGH